MHLRQLFLRHLAPTSDAPLMLDIERAEGVYLYGPDGKRYLDLISGISVSALGHGYPAVVQAIQEQAARYSHLMVYGELVQGPQVGYARLLCSVLPPQLQSVYFVNSGSEANEAAIKLAKRATGRTEIIGFQNAYHGSTQGLLSLMGDEAFRRPFRPLIPGTRLLRFNSMDDLTQITQRTACVVAEVVQAEAGVMPAEPEWILALRNRCTETGALLILDEIQTGFGRTGKLWGYEQYGTVPDILTLAKGMGGGMPIGAMVASRELMQAFAHHPALGHITTFGGNAVCCAAANALLQTLLETDYISTVEARSAQMMDKLTHPLIRAKRASGFLAALEFDSFDTNKRVIDAAIKRGIITDWFLFAPHCLRIAPPLIISEKEIDEACSILLESMEEVGKG